MARSSKAKPKSQGVETSEMSTSDEKPESDEESEEPTEDQGAEGDSNNPISKPKSQEVETSEMPTSDEKLESDKESGSDEKPESDEESEESTEDQGAEGDGNNPISKEPKTLIAMRPILYLAKQYKAGDRLPVNNQEMVSAWIEAGSAAWQESGKRQSP